MSTVVRISLALSLTLFACPIPAFADQPASADNLPTSTTAQTGNSNPTAPLVIPATSPAASSTAAPLTTDSAVPAATPNSTTASADPSSPAHTPATKSGPTTLTPVAVPNNSVDNATSAPPPAILIAPSTPTISPAVKAVESADDKLAALITKYDTLRTKDLAGQAQEEERLMPIAGMQKQVVQLESMFGRSNANVVMLYHLLARRYQTQAYVTGKFADAERLYRWLTDTPPAQKGFDELFYGSAYLAMADGYRMTRRYDLALTTYQRSIPIFARGKKAALNVIADYKTFGESGRDRVARTESQSKVNGLVANNKTFMDTIEKSLGNERYVARPEADAYFGMAVCYLNKKDLGKARESFEKARANGLQLVDIAKMKAAAKRSPLKAGRKAGAK